MKFNFRKISSVLGSAAMVGSTFALAAAATYPAPFVSGGSSDVAVVYGSGAASTDYAAATNIGSDLSASLASQSVSVGGEVSATGENAPLFGGTKLYLNDSLNAVKTTLTKNQLPTVLADTDFSGDVDVKITQNIQVGGNPIIKIDKMPTTSDDPKFGLSVGTNAQTQNIYNLSATFNKALDFTDADTEGEEISLFGQKFTIGSATDTTKIVLLKTAVKVNLDSSDNPSQDITVGTSKYTVTLISASDTSATIRVTDSSGASDQKEVNEAASKKINGLTVAVNTADENNLKYSASIIAGAEKVTLTNASSVTYGEDDKVMDGTYAVITGTINASTGITFSVAAADSDADAILPGSNFIDPIFGSFKVDFAGMNIADDSDMREKISVKGSGDDKIVVTFTDHQKNEKTIQFGQNVTNKPFIQMAIDDSDHNITVRERAPFYKGDYVVVGNEDDGHLLKLSSVALQSGTTYDSDKVTFTDVFSGTTYDTSITAKYLGTVDVGGRTYNVNYSGSSGNNDAVAVYLNDQSDSSGNNVILFNTIETSKGAKLAFVAPQNFSLDNWDGLGNDATGLMFPDGDGYTTVTTAYSHTIGTTNYWNITAGGSTTTMNLTGATNATVTIGKLTYSISNAGNAAGGNRTLVRLRDVGGTPLNEPALVIFEEKDDDSNYNALIVKVDSVGNSDNGLGVSDVERTWDTDSTGWELTLASDSDIKKEADYWGSIITTDNSDSDQASVAISYPDEQIYAQIYVSAIDAVISTENGPSSILPVKDSEVASVSTKNLLVIGGSCINTVAAKLLGSSTPLCGADFTTKTSVGSGEYLIQTIQSPYTDSKVATLVAGYEAADTTNAVNALKTQKPEITAGKKFKGTTASSLSAA